MFARFAAVPVLVATMFMPVAPAMAQVEDVTIKPVFVAGQELPYSFASILRTNHRVDDGPEDNLDTVTTHALTKLKIDEVSADGSVKATITFDKAMVQAVLADQERGFEWPSKLPLADDAPASQKLGNVLSGAKIALSVDPAGQVTVTSGFEEFLDAAAKIESPDPRLLGFFTPDAFADMVEPVFRMDDAPQAPRGINKGWQTVDRVELPPVGVTEFTNSWTLMNVDRELVRYITRMSVQMLQPEEKGEGVPTVRFVEPSAGSVEAYFDRQKNLLRRRKCSMSLFSEWTMGGSTIHQTQQSTITIVIMDENLNMKLDPNRQW